MLQAQQTEWSTKESREQRPCSKEEHDSRSQPASRPGTDKVTCVLRPCRHDDRGRFFGGNSCKAARGSGRRRRRRRHRTPASAARRTWCMTSTAHARDDDDTPPRARGHSNTAVEGDSAAAAAAAAEPAAVPAPAAPAPSSRNTRRPNRFCVSRNRTLLATGSSPSPSDSLRQQRLVQPGHHCGRNGKTRRCRFLDRGTSTRSS
jgi:hypothetical protein